MKNFIHFHSWVYGDRIRKCSTCPKRQWYHGIFLSGSWRNTPEPPKLCCACNGTGVRLRNDFEETVCPNCNGKGHS